MSRYYDEKNLKQIGRALKKFRIDAGLSRSALDELTGFNINTIRNIENGKEFTMSYFLKICATLRVPPITVFEEVKFSLKAGDKDLEYFSSISITRSVHKLIQSNFFQDYRKTKEVQNELNERFELELESKILSAILIRLVKESYLEKKKEGRLNVYKKATER